MLFRRWEMSNGQAFRRNARLSRTGAVPIVSPDRLVLDVEGRHFHAGEGLLRGRKKHLCVLTKVFLQMLSGSDEKLLPLCALMALSRPEGLHVPWCCLNCVQIASVQPWPVKSYPGYRVIQ